MKMLIEKVDSKTQDVSVALAIDEKGRDVTKLVRLWQDVESKELKAVWPTEKEIKEAKIAIEEPVEPIGVEKG